MEEVNEDRSSAETEPISSTLDSVSLQPVCSHSNSILRHPNWYHVGTELEFFGPFLSMLRSFNSCALQCCSEKIEDRHIFDKLKLRSLIESRHFLWRMFDGLPLGSLPQGSIVERLPILDEASINHYILPLTDEEKALYVGNGESAHRISTNPPDFSSKYFNKYFIDRCRILSSITKKCPVQVRLLSKLHQKLMESPVTNVTPRVIDESAQFKVTGIISIDKNGIVYLRLRVRRIHSAAQTSRFTRLFGEQRCLSIQFKHASVPMHPQGFATLTDLKRRLKWFDKTLDGKNSKFYYVNKFRSLDAMLQNVIQLSDHCRSQLLEEKLNIFQNEFSVRSAHDSRFDHGEDMELFRDRLRKAYDGIFKEGVLVGGHLFEYLLTTSSGIHENKHIFFNFTYPNSQALGNKDGTIIEHVPTGNDRLHHENSSELPDSSSKDRRLMNLMENNDIAGYDVDIGILEKWIFSDKSLKELKSKSVKLNLRMGLWFTPTISVILPSSVRVEPPMSDIGPHTDGCGLISADLAIILAREWCKYKHVRNVTFTNPSRDPMCWDNCVEHDSEIEFMTGIPFRRPSAFQIRLDGVKGMLATWTKLEPNTICLTKSQIKFRRPPSTKFYKQIDIVSCSQPMKPARLNYALITLIVGCSSDPNSTAEHLRKLAKDTFTTESERLLSNREEALRFAIQHNDVNSFNLLGSGCQLDQAFLSGYYQNYLRRFKIIVPQSRRLYGVADFTKTLEPNTVYIKISPDICICDRDVIVTKEPCYHRGDLRRLKAVKNAQLDELQLYDVLIFSVKDSPSDSSRSEASKICGSDLDGDQYFVCWDPDIVQRISPQQYGEFDSVEGTNFPKQFKDEYEIQVERDDTLQKAGIDLDSRSDHQIFTERQSNNDNSHNNLTDEELLRTVTESVIQSHGYDPHCASLHDLFDMRSRCVDAIESMWTSWTWEHLMDKFSYWLTIALDSAKTSRISKANHWYDFLPRIPSYPHFHTGKRAQDCRHSMSPAGRIYDTLTELVANKINCESVFHQTEERTDMSANRTGMIKHFEVRQSNVFVSSSSFKARLYLELTQKIPTCRISIGISNESRSILTDKACTLQYEENGPFRSEAYLTLVNLLPKRNYKVTITILIGNEVQSDTVDISIPEVHQFPEPVSVKNSVQDEINALKMKFLYEYIISKSKDSVSSVVEICSSQTTSVSLLQREAVCTLFWQVLVYQSLALKLTESPSTHLYLCIVKDSMSLGMIGRPMQDRLIDIIINEKNLCLCLPKRLFFDDVHLKQWEIVSEQRSICKLYHLDYEQAKTVVEHLRDKLKDRIWRDLKMPEPSSQSVNSSFDDLWHRFENIDDACNSEDHRDKFIHLLRVSVELLCYDQLWSDEQRFRLFQNKLSEYTNTPNTSPTVS